MKKLQIFLTLLVLLTTLTSFAQKAKIRIIATGGTIAGVATAEAD